MSRKKRSITGKTTDFLVYTEDMNFIKQVAKLQKYCDFSTTQRDDANEIIRGVKMDGEQVIYRYDNMVEFCKCLTKKVKQLSKDVKTEINEITKN